MVRLLVAVVVAGVESLDVAWGKYAVAPNQSAARQSGVTPNHGVAPYQGSSREFSFEYKVAPHQRVVPDQRVSPYQSQIAEDGYRVRRGIEDGLRRECRARRKIVVGQRRLDVQVAGSDCKNIALARVADQRVRVNPGAV